MMKWEILTKNKYIWLNYKINESLRNLQGITCLMLTKNNNNKIKCKIEEKNNLYYGCDDCSFIKLEANRRGDRNNKQAIFQDYAPCMDCITKKRHTSR